MHATEFLKDSAQHETGPVVVTTGDQISLKHSVLASICKNTFGDAEDDDTSVTRYSGNDAELTTVRDELLTLSMWNDQRIVVVDDADDFVKQNRAGLESYVANPSKKSIFVLAVKSFPKNTRLAKMVAKIGLTVECTELTGTALNRYVNDAAVHRHGKELTRNATQLLTELAGNNLGLLDQELAKLAAYVGDRNGIDVEDVRKMVGGWKAETTWAMINAVRDDRIGVALSCLEKLLVAGEAPQKILGGLNFVYRKLALATELARQGGSLNAAMNKAGVFPRDIGPSQQYLRRLGRPRAEKILSWLIQTDNNLKGGSRVPERLQLEELLVRLSGKA